MKQGKIGERQDNPCNRIIRGFFLTAWDKKKRGGRESLGGETPSSCQLPLIYCSFISFLSFILSVFHLCSIIRPTRFATSKQNISLRSNENIDVFNFRDVVIRLSSVW